jgi:GDP-L-fucose synthase
VEKKFNGPINWGTGHGVSVREIADTVATMLGHEELVENLNPPAADPFPFVVADATRLRHLGWQPQVDLKAGLAGLIKAFEANPRV